ncbi:MAG: hypothetical protein ACPGOT_02410 [Candidatus Poseidoniaceae archaeon]
MTETPEVPDDEATESKTDMKERMRSFGEKAKAFGEKTGKRSKELGKKVAEATKETTAKAAKATKKTTAKVAEATKETTAKAAEAGKKAGSRLSESTAEASEKISVAAEQATKSVSKGVKQTKEKLKQAKEQRDERKAQAATVPQTTQVIMVGPDLPIEEMTNSPSTQKHERNHGDHQDSLDTSDATQNGDSIEQKQFVIMPPSNIALHPDTPKKPSLGTSLGKTLRSWSTPVFMYGPDLLFGWLLLFLVLSTTVNAISAVSDASEQLAAIPFGIPHVEVGFDTGNAWIIYACSLTILVLLFDTILLSFAPARYGSYQRIAFALGVSWFIPGISNGPEFILTPFESSDLLGFFWHIFILPLVILVSLIRSSVIHERNKPSLPHSHSSNSAIAEGEIQHKSASFSYTPSLKSLPELRPMNAPDGLLDKPKRRDSMEFYEWVFFLFMWLFIFAGVAMGVMAAQANDAANSVLQSSYMPAIGLCLGLAVILAYILYKMDRAARSGIDMAKRRERFHAMQDEVWETWRTEARLKREQLEQEHTDGASGVSA